MADILRYAQTMTDQPQSADEPEVREITFRERVLLVKMPSPEQLVVWKRIATQIERLNEASNSLSGVFGEMCSAPAVRCT